MNPILGKEVVMYSSDQPGKNIVEYDNIHLSISIQFLGDHADVV